MINTDGLGILQPICSVAACFCHTPELLWLGKDMEKLIASMVHLLDAAFLQVWKVIYISRMGYCLQGSLGNVLVGSTLLHDFLRSLNFKHMLCAPTLHTQVLGRLSWPHPSRLSEMVLLATPFFPH